MRKFRVKKGWTQPELARRLQLQGWSISTASLGKLEAGLRRVPDCELLFLAKVLGIALADLFPRGLPLKDIGPRFQTGDRRAIFPMRAEK